MQIAQLSYDNRLPPEPVDNGAAAEWIANGVEQLLLGADVKWKRRFERPKSVTADDFRDRVQCHLVDRQIAGEDQRDSFADVVLAAHRGVADKTSAIYLLGAEKMLEALAVELLKPHAADGVAALLEEAEDDQGLDV
jgi:hypothetical protein